MVPIEPVWYAVLRTYRQAHLGVGLSANMLCHLTQMDWPDLKREMQFYYDDQYDTDPKSKKSVLRLKGVGMYSDYCHTEVAHLLIYQPVKPEGYPLKFANTEAQLDKYPWREFPSVHKGGQTWVNLKGGEPTYRALQAVVRSYGIEPGDAPYYGLAPQS